MENLNGKDCYSFSPKKSMVLPIWNGLKYLTSEIDLVSCSICVLVKPAQKQRVQKHEWKFDLLVNIIEFNVAQICLGYAVLCWMLWIPNDFV